MEKKLKINAFSIVLGLISGLILLLAGILNIVMSFRVTIENTCAIITGVGTKRLLPIRILSILFILTVLLTVIGLCIGKKNVITILGSLAMGFVWLLRAVIAIINVVKYSTYGMFTKYQVTHFRKIMISDILIFIAFLLFTLILLVLTIPKKEKTSFAAGFLGLIPAALIGIATIVEGSSPISMIVTSIGMVTNGKFNLFMKVLTNSYAYPIMYMFVALLLCLALLFASFAVALQIKRVKKADNTAQPQNAQQPSYNQAPTYAQQPTYNQAPSYTQQPTYNQAPSYTQQSSYSQVPRYEQQPYTQQGWNGNGPANR